MSSLLAILSERYGVGLLAAPAVAVIWAAEFMAAEHGADAARKALATANRKREKAGVIPAYVPYGRLLFGGRR